MQILPSWHTFETGIEVGEKGSRTLDYSLLLFLKLLPNHPPWMDSALLLIHHSRDLIEFGTCCKEIGSAYRGLNEMDKGAETRFVSPLLSLRVAGDLFICLSAALTPLALAHEWVGLPLGRFTTPIEAISRWSISIGHGIRFFGVEGVEQIHMGGEALFFGMEAGFLEKIGIPTQAVIAVGSGTFGLWHIFHSCS